LKPADKLTEKSAHLRRPVFTRTDRGCRPSAYAELLARRDSNGAGLSPRIAARFVDDIATCRCG
jgi:hypothetical protein